MDAPAYAELLPVSIDAPDVVDRRSEFARIFCTLLEADQVFSAHPCGDFLHLDDTAQARTAEASSLEYGRFRYLIVPGYGSECFPRAPTPFESARELLQGAGADIGLLMVPGRASSAHNARS